MVSAKHDDGGTEDKKQPMMELLIHIFHAAKTLWGA
jgi:hypothetical protein